MDTVLKISAYRGRIAVRIDRAQRDVAKCVRGQRAAARIDQRFKRPAGQRVRQRDGRVEDVLIVQILDVGPQLAAIERIGRADLDLAAQIGVLEAGVAQAVVAAVEAADRRHQAIRDRPRDIGIAPRPVTRAGFDPHGTLVRGRAVPSNEVDDTTGRIIRIDRRGPASHHFGALGIQIDAVQFVDVQIPFGVAFEQRHAVLVEIDQAPSAPGQATYDDVLAAAFAAGRLHGDAWGRLQQVGDTVRSHLVDPLAIDRRHRIGRVELALAG